MPFGILDIIFIIILSGFLWKGYKEGFIKSLSYLLSLMVGLYGAARLYRWCAYWLSIWTGWGVNFTHLLMFVLLTLIVARLVLFLLYLLDRFLQLIFKIPGVRSLNKLLGATCMFLQGVLILVVFIYIFKETGISGAMNRAIASSFFAKYLIHASSWVWPFLPATLKNVL